MYLFPLEAHLSAEVLLGPVHLGQDFTLFFSGTSRTQTGFPRVRCWQISESNSEFSIRLILEHCPHPLQNIPCGLSNIF